MNLRIKRKLAKDRRYVEAKDRRDRRMLALESSADDFIRGRELPCDWYQYYVISQGWWPRDASWPYSLSERILEKTGSLVEVHGLPPYDSEEYCALDAFVRLLPVAWEHKRGYSGPLLTKNWIAIYRFSEHVRVFWDSRWVWDTRFDSNNRGRMSPRPKNLT